MSIGERIRAARRIAGLSQEKLRLKVGVTKQSISKYENDKAVPGSAVLLRIARAVDVQVDFFLRPAPMPRVIQPAYRAHCSRLRQKDRQAIEERVREWLERYLELESFLPGSYYQRFVMPKSFPRLVHSMDEAEDRAVELREAWKLGLGPINSVVEVLEGMGIRVCAVDASVGFDGLTFETEAGQYVIVIKRDVPGDRQRLSAAHELGHLLLKPAARLDPEKVAFRFAAAFLVPRSAALQELGPNRQSLELWELRRLKRKYGLSMQAWIYRAGDLGIIKQAYSRRLFKEFRRRGWHKEEPGPEVPAEEPQRMKALGAIAYAERYASPSRVAELLGEKLEKLRQEFDRYGSATPSSCH